jgi:PAS domain S-box-containing protein
LIDASGIKSDSSRAQRASAASAAEVDLAPSSRWLLGRGVAIALAAAMGAMVLIFALSILQFSGLGRTFEAVDDAHRHIRALRNVLIQLVDAETAHRGYLLTGRSEYLEPYDAAIREMDGAKAHLRDVMSDTPEHRANLERIERLADEKLAVMAESLSAYRRGDMAAAAAIVSAGRGKDTMDEFRRLIDVREKEQVGTLGVRSQRMAELRGRLWLVLGLGFVLALLVGAAIVAMNRRLRSAVAAQLAAQRDFRDTLESMSDSFCHLDREWRITYMNRRAAKHFERPADELVGQHVWEALPQAVGTPIERRYRAAMDTGKAQEFEVQSPTFPDRVLSIRVYPTPTGLAVFFRDISTERRLQEQLQHAAKLESIGRLAGGVAHDFNNLLTAILGYVELAEISLPGDSPIRSHMVGIRHAAERSAALTKQLLTFARKQVIEPRVCGINELVANAEKLLVRLMTDNIVVKASCSPDTGLTEVDPDQFEQVLINLAVNARDAMPNGGKLIIETSNAVLDEEYAARHDDVTPGEYVMLAISDTGVGMDEEVRRHIFEPFYTTKKRGEGTGLGLASCYGLVRQARGHIWVYSEPNHGTTFKIYLPRVYATPASASAPTPPAPIGGSEVILVVEDEELVLRLAVRVLEMNGHRVLSATTAEAAMTVAAEYRGNIDLLLTDVILPKMNGRQLAQKLTAQRPGLRVLYASGYTDNMIVHHGVLDAGVEFLQKPYMPSTLMRKVRDVLGRPAAEVLA